MGKKPQSTLGIGSGFTQNLPDYHTMVYSFPVRHYSWACDSSSEVAKQRCVHTFNVTVFLLFDQQTLQSYR